eukprot:3535514-Prymnesium_polylepis.1
MGVANRLEMDQAAVRAHQGSAARGRNLIAIEVINRLNLVREHGIHQESKHNVAGTDLEDERRADASDDCPGTDQRAITKRCPPDRGVALPFLVHLEDGLHLVVCWAELRGK